MRPAMTDEPDPAVPAVDPRRWAAELCAAAVVVTLLTGALFYFTTRGLFGRVDAPAPAARLDPLLKVVSLDHGLAVYAQQCAACHGAKGLGDGPAAAALTPK